MKKDVEVFIVVICDQKPDKAPSPELIIKVRNAIEKINGITETSLSRRTDEIGAFALLEEDKIPLMIEEIKNTHGVNKVDFKILVPITKRNMI